MTETQNERESLLASLFACLPADHCRASMMDSLSIVLEQMKVSGGIEEEEALRTKLDTILRALEENTDVREPCIQAGLVSALVPLLETSDQELLLHTGQAIGRLCFDNNSQQEALVQCGVIPRLVRIMKQFPENDVLVNVCLLALCNLADLDSAREALIEMHVTEVLTVQLRHTSNAERRHVILEVLGALGESNGNCIHMVDSGVVSQILDLLERHVDEGDVSVQQAALSALRNLAIPAVNKVRMLQDGVSERIRKLLCSEMPPVQFKLLGMLRMMVDGQEEAAAVLGQDEALLYRVMQWCDARDHAGMRGEANRLLAALIRHSRAPEVVKAVTQAEGVQHLITMAMNEHVIMQNKALVALAIASTIDIDAVEEPFMSAGLLSTLQQMLEDPVAAVEVKFSTVGLVCSLVNSVELRSQMEALALRETLGQLRNHSNSKLASQADTALSILAETS
ncbi:rap1 GTPase-GDP dissociation stimulator 1-like isoform X1 [Polyodon spathula]|uniref:rap1 GTPase-GDP dissociation stimulator 1-like isoform X1 n=1 Tax=Polyodon spathula TaxID=7913 RepID=UPI001B7E2C2E|nr:rap1 GTPase-GDP dissociation stimulator 1-like isoform X1 [Polyodon spathula]